MLIKYRDHVVPVPEVKEQVSQKQQQLPLQSLLKPIGSKEFHCVSCPKSYKHKHHLKDHQNVCARRLQQQQLIGSNMFHCVPCGKSYRYKGGLQAHEKTHTNTFPCSFDCGKIYSQKHLLDAHEWVCSRRGGMFWD